MTDILSLIRSGRVLDLAGRVLEAGAPVLDAVRNQLEDWAEGVSPSDPRFPGDPRLTPPRRLAADSVRGVSGLLDQHAVMARLVAVSRPEFQGHPAKAVMAANAAVRNHPHAAALLDFVTSVRSAKPEKFPKTTRAAFRAFHQSAPHALKNGALIHEWADQAEAALQQAGHLDDSARIQAQNGITLLRDMTLRASVTASEDLWVARQLLSTYKKIGIVDYLNTGEAIDPVEYARKHQLKQGQLETDFGFLAERGYLEKIADGRFRKARAEGGRALYGIQELQEGLDVNMAMELADLFNDRLDRARDGEGKPTEYRSETIRILRYERIQRWYRQVSNMRLPDGDSWVPGLQDMEIGYFLVPLVLGIHASGNGKGKVKAGQPVRVPNLDPGSIDILRKSGCVKDGLWTSTAEWLFNRGTGPIGIIYTYYQYLQQHEAFLRADGKQPHVTRAENVGYAGEANQAGFVGMAYAAYDLLEQLGLLDEIQMFGEHAIGHGVGTQEFLKVLREKGRNDIADRIQFYGMDYERAALDAGAMKEQAAGNLPRNMLLGQADIGEPGQMFKSLQGFGVPLEKLRNSVMVVGAGFHEVRKDDAGIIETFRQYREKGIILVFDETSDLSLEQVLESGFQTNHAAFRWVHETSGQKLRAPWIYDGYTMRRMSWKEVIEKAGYRLHPLTFGQRQVFPVEDMGLGQNPPTRVSYVCVPPELDSRWKGSNGRAPTDRPGLPPDVMRPAPRGNRASTRPARSVRSAREAHFEGRRGTMPRMARAGNILRLK